MFLKKLKRAKGPGFFKYLNSWRLFINVFSAPIKGIARCYASLHSDFHEHLWSHDAGKACHRESYVTQTMYRLVNLSWAPWDLVPSEARYHIEWRVKGLTTYLVHGSHEKLNSLCIYLLLKILLLPQWFHQLNSNYRQSVLKLNPNYL